jgi:transposase-like protein
MADKPATGNQGKRYSVKEKAEIIEFIIAYDAENKRGGMKAASDKYGVSVVTLSNWKKNDKGPKKRKAKAKKVTAKKSVKTPATPAKLVGDTPEAILSRLQQIRVEIHTLEKEYDGLKKKL